MLTFILIYQRFGENSTVQEHNHMPFKGLTVFVITRTTHHKKGGDN